MNFNDISLTHLKSFVTHIFLLVMILNYERYHILDLFEVNWL